MRPGVDDLTGLPSRRAFEHELDGALERARGAGGQVAVVVASLMGLPIVHARHGRDAVGRALRAAADRVVEAAGADGVVGRVGEDLFAVLVDGGAEVAEALVAQLDKAFADEVDVGPATVRMGVATATGTGPTRPQADDALLWRTVESAAHRRAALLHAVIEHEILRGARTLDEVGPRIVADACTRFALRAASLEVGDRLWWCPSESPPEDEPDGTWPLATPLRRVGEFRAWGVRPEELDQHAVGLLFSVLASAIERALVVDASEGRARRDPLTGLLNRDGLQRALTTVATGYALGVVDVDRFKDVNDRHGHDVGDSLLRGLASLLAHGRSTDLVSRWGGDEIVVVMPGTTAEGAAVRLERVLDECRATLRAGDDALTFSAGVTEVEPDGDLLDAVRVADQAMYAAKAAGRARVHVAREEAR